MPVSAWMGGPGGWLFERGQRLQAGSQRISQKRGLAITCWRVQAPVHLTTKRHPHGVSQYTHEGVDGGIARSRSQGLLAALHVPQAVPGRLVGAAAPLLFAVDHPKRPRYGAPVFQQRAASHGGLPAS
jgi:hypothetical protein